MRFTLTQIYIGILRAMGMALVIEGYRHYFFWSFGL